jgi:hypothetical protein
MEFSFRCLLYISVPCNLHLKLRLTNGFLIFMAESERTFDDVGK